jgi:hypothetical protein
MSKITGIFGQTLVWGVLVLILASGCGTGSTYGGVQLEVLDIYDAVVTLNNRGEVVLDTSVSIPTPLRTEALDLNIVVGYQQILQQAASSNYHLFLIWKDEQSERITEYDMGRPFHIYFRESQRVQEIYNNQPNSLVVLVDTTQDTIQPLIQTVVVTVPVEVPANQNNQKNYSCPGAPPVNLTVDSKAYICTKVDEVIVRSEPSHKASEVVRLKPGQEMTILKGPVCDRARGYNYWRIRTDDGTLGWIPDGTDNRDAVWICPK